MGHAYSIITVLKTKEGVQLLKIRNPWGQFEWNGDFSDGHKTWTKEIVSQVRPVFDQNDGSFWMSFKDFTKNFKLLNVCKVGDYPEIRVKGEFYKDLDQTVNGNLVHSRFVYEIEIEQKQTINFSIHQEDIRIQDTILRKPYIAIGMVILRKEPSGKLELIYMKEF